MKTSKKFFLIVLWALAILAIAAVVWVRVVEPRMTETVADTLGRGDYVLTGTDGSVVTEDTLKGTPTAVFFGFTHCPEVCPTTLGDVADWQEALAEDGEALRVLFFTVDPERDTAEVLSDYVSWVPGVVGVTGTTEEMTKATKAFRVYAQKVPLENGHYTMDHSASVLLFDKSGTFFEPIGYQEGYDRAVAKIRRMIKG
ncbi:SCO family protein [Pseudoruegeria sp. SK021]|uniref:SCO family protein n=1 Tax=Pseudoruegeria sp. SK021 TaxID=1933035 RepID=UPI000A26398F|nr:SCO family protein [Pseudoruegeria sp. SK021]OSP56137.1 SCO family protein [Pseudoruegeria sp. SK021]